jgi:hypothetical protein
LRPMSGLERGPKAVSRTQKMFSLTFGKFYT